MSRLHCIYQLRGHAYLPFSPRYAPFQDVTHTEFFSNPSDLDRLSLVAEARNAKGMLLGLAGVIPECHADGKTMSPGGYRPRPICRLSADLRSTRGLGCLPQQLRNASGRPSARFDDRVASSNAVDLGASCLYSVTIVSRPSEFIMRADSLQQHSLRHAGLRDFIETWSQDNYLVKTDGHTSALALS